MPDELDKRVSELEKGQATLEERTATMQRDISVIRTDIKSVDVKIDVNSQKSIEGHMKVLGEVHAIREVQALISKTISEINEPLKKLKGEVEDERIDTAHRQGGKDTLQYLVYMVLAVLTCVATLAGVQSCQYKREIEQAKEVGRP